MAGKPEETSLDEPSSAEVPLVGASILLAGFSAATAEELAAALRLRGCLVLSVEGTRAAMIARTFAVDVVLVDVDTALEVSQRVVDAVAHARRAQTPAILGVGRERRVEPGSLRLERVDVERIVGALASTMAHRRAA